MRRGFPNMRVAIFIAAILAFVLAAAALPMSAPAEAGASAPRPHVVKSVRDLKATVAGLEAALRRRGVETVVKLDRPNAPHAAATLVMFAEPRLAPAKSGYALDEIEPKLRALVFQDGEQVSIAYDDARLLARRAGLSLDDAAAANRALADVAAEAAS